MEIWQIGSKRKGTVSTGKGGGWAPRKYLQNDEVIEYALDHSDLFCPSRAKREIFLAEPPKVSGTRSTLLWPPSITFRWSRGTTSDINGILR